MAKGNMLNGTVKGRIGDAVYYVKQGEQNIVKYNKEIANPRTGRQMYQRARFSNAGRFFTRGRQNYFKFAFEGKKSSQSDFNAFMAYNINRSVLISRSALQLEGYPAIGKFIMSQGSLQPVQNRIVNDYWQATFGVAMPEGSITTIGQLSRLLINTGNYELGDILTFVFIWTSGSAYIPSAQPMGTANTTWHLKQFILNPTDSTPLSNYEMRAVSRAWGDQNLLTLTDLEDSQIIPSSYSGFCCVHSRNTRSGLKVSTQELALGESMQEAYEYAQTSEYIDSVIADWQSTGNITYSPDAILKGSLSYSASPVTGITLAEVPASQWQLSGNTFYTDEEIYPFALLTPAAIMGVGVVPGMFQADNISGDAAAYVSFVQAATNQVDVHIDSTNLPAGVYAVRIYMLKGEQRIPICNIVWTSVTGEIEIEPFRLDTTNWSINGNTLSLNTPYDSTGERFVIGFDSPDELSVKNFSAEKTSGGDGTSMRFAVVEDEIRGAISITNPADGAYSYNVYYTHDGKKQLVAIVNFGVGETSITMTPLCMNGNQPVFTSNVELPKGKIYVGFFREQADTGLFTVNHYGDVGYTYTQVFNWSNKNNRWEFLEDGQLRNFIEPLGNNQYRFGGNADNYWLQPFFVEIDGEKKWINQDSILWTDIVKEGSGDWSIDNPNIELPLSGVTSRTLVAHLVAKHGDQLLSHDTLSISNQSTGISVDVETDAGGEYYNIYVTCAASSTGYVDILWNTRELVSIYRQEE